MISFEEPIIGIEEKKLLNEVLNKSSVAQGPYVERFEKIISSYCNTKFASACFNGTAALHLALAALDIKQGDEVIVPSFTFIATANAVTYTGAKPVFTDIKKNTLCLDPNSLKKKITNKTKAIIPVHVFGNPCDMNSIKGLAKENDLSVIEDAAEAIGAVYRGKKVGSLSDIGCFSFYNNKIISTGEGGMCLTDNQELNGKLKLLRSQGKVKNEDLKGDDFIEKKYYHEMLGFNYRMTDLQAAIGISQMKKIDDNLKSRKRVAKIYENEFKKYDINIMKNETSSNPVYWIYPIIFKNKKIKMQVGKELRKKEIPFLSFFWPCHKQPFYDSPETLPITEEVSERGLSIPCIPSISDEEAIDLTRIIGNVVKNA
ncbi:DegT/DnrJ/EryC1/StrS aminotransferase family protein [Candidatus Pacearchaeota archaeon]|nr:DegT/DnrJ/EryC1/StrS aminotransferase family protein [Candidatus Pacearchaeota archaeon]